MVGGAVWLLQTTACFLSKPDLPNRVPAASKNLQPVYRRKEEARKGGTLSLSFSHGPRWRVGARGGEEVDAR